MAQKNTPTYKAILRKFEACSEDVRGYFEFLPSLIEDYPYEVALGYLFLRTEKAQNRTLYCGVVKLHRAHTEVAGGAVNVQHLTRDGFIALYENIFGHSLLAPTAAKIKMAEKIRDKVIHGKAVNAAQMREAIVDVLAYAEALNADLERAAGFKPFGSLRGFKGRGMPLDKGTTRWLLKGLGFALA